MAVVNYDGIPAGVDWHSIPSESVRHDAPAGSAPALVHYARLGRRVQERRTSRAPAVLFGTLPGGQAVTPPLACQTRGAYAESSDRSAADAKLAPQRVMGISRPCSAYHRSATLGISERGGMVSGSFGENRAASNCARGGPSTDGQGLISHTCSYSAIPSSVRAHTWPRHSIASPRMSRSTGSHRCGPGTICVLHSTHSAASRMLRRLLLDRPFK